MRRRSAEKHEPGKNALSHFRRVRRGAADHGKKEVPDEDGARGDGVVKAARTKTETVTTAKPKTVTPEKRKLGAQDQLPSDTGNIRFTSPVYVSPSVKVMLRRKRIRYEERLDAVLTPICVGRIEADGFLTHAYAHLFTFHRSHSRQRVYRLIDKKSYLDWGLTSDWLTADRRRRTPSKRATATTELDTSARKQLFSQESEGGRGGEDEATNSGRDSSSEGYGEMTEGSIQRLLRSLQSPLNAEVETEAGKDVGGTLIENEDRVEVDPSRYALGKSSSFIDVGSGYGKVVFYAAMAVPLKDAHGIEYVESRSKKVNEAPAKQLRVSSCIEYVAMSFLICTGAEVLVAK